MHLQPSDLLVVHQQDLLPSQNIQAVVFNQGEQKIAQIGVTI
jgi:hypothetical protein